MGVACSPRTPGLPAPPERSAEPVHTEILAVGTELLLGQIIDTNSTHIAEQLASSGLDCHFQTSVGDNLGRIVPVSYTHLDVYKRQAVTGASPSIDTCCHGGRLTPGEP